ncbi:unnamed protein product [Mytilus coruscus]|uniref:Uncharacterized protein n=1 Tax=Mytilus coruscus TaxID=42192 RepID=A0A6J8E7E5_MYTCO|nr:unnamed protein product [Mytilus coruscus]
MLPELQLLSLQSRRQQQRLIFFFKVVEGKIPALPPDDLIKFHRPKHTERDAESDGEEASEPTGYSLHASIENSEDVQGLSKACSSRRNVTITKKTSKPILDLTEYSTNEDDIRKLFYPPTFKPSKKRSTERQTQCKECKRKKSYQTCIVNLCT